MSAIQNSKSQGFGDIHDRRIWLFLYLLKFMDTSFQLVKDADAELKKQARLIELMGKDLVFTPGQYKVSAKRSQ